jgi:dTDP-4-amino-4,6-dideoxygalactose transaminase
MPTFVGMTSLVTFYEFVMFESHEKFMQKKQMERKENNVMDFIDLKTQQKRVKEQLDKNIQRVLEHGNYIMGPEVKQLEEKLAEYVGVKHAIGCASGTDALLMALMAYNIGPGDAIFTTPFTFIATAEVITLLGATPVFVDIDPKTYNIDSAKLEQAVNAVKNNDKKLYPLPLTVNRSPLTVRGVIPVDLYGLLADYDTIDTIANKHGIFVIEDAAQSFGAECKGRKSCFFGNVACTSFFPAKPLGCYGDGGMCFTDDDNLAAALDSIRVHGKGSHKYDNARIGINGRLDTLQAAILLAKFEIFPEEIELRQEVASRYSTILGNNTSLLTPNIPGRYKSAWAQYSLLATDGNNRTEIQAKLQENNIPTAIYYPKPLHLQTAFAGLGYKPGDFPVSEDIASRIFSLPMHPYLTKQDQIMITEAIKE